MLHDVKQMSLQTPQIHAGGLRRLPVCTGALVLVCRSLRGFFAGSCTYSSKLGAWSGAYPLLGFPSAAGARGAGGACQWLGRVVLWGGWRDLVAGGAQLSCLRNELFVPGVCDGSGLAEGRRLRDRAGARRVAPALRLKLVTGIHKHQADHLVILGIG